MRLDITPYLDIYEANEYFTTRLDTQDWDYAIETEKLKALKTATRMINRLNFKGIKLDYLQDNEFPRRVENNIVDVTTDLKLATCEIAILLLNDYDIEQEITNLYNTTLGYASVSTGKTLGIVPDHVRAGIPSAVAWSYLRPYLIDPLECRVNSKDTDGRF